MPLDMVRFAMPDVAGNATASDHYGIIATYPAAAAVKAPPVK
jgi:hypothetical protein